MKRVNMPVYSIGDVARNVLTGEEGQIVRTLNSSEILRKVEPQQPAQPAYIVSLPAGPFAGPREALWLRSEVIPNRDTCQEADECATADGLPQVCWVCGKGVLAEDCRIDDLGKPVHLACHLSDSVPINVGPAQ